MSNGVPYSQALPPNLKAVQKQYGRVRGGVVEMTGATPDPVFGYYYPSMSRYDLAPSSTWYETTYVQKTPEEMALVTPEQQAEYQAKVSALMPAATSAPAPATQTMATQQTTTPTTPAASATPAGYGASSYTGVSIVDYLKSLGKASDYASRATLAQQFGITGYAGTAAQNTQLLGMLRAGSPTPPAPTPPAPIIPEVSTTTPSPVATSGEARAATLKKELEAGTTKPTPYSSVDEFDKLRTAQGVVQDESELTAIRNEADLGKEELRQFKAKAGVGVSMGGYTGRVSEAEQNLNFRLEGLAIRENAVVNRLNSKNSYISTVMNLKQQDYNTAYQQYTDTWNQNLQIQQLVSKEQDQAKQDATTTLNTMTNLLTNSGISWSQLTPAVQAQITSLELQSGLPQGFTSQVFAQADKPTLTTIISDDKTTATIIYKDGTTKSISTGMAPQVGGGTVSERLAPILAQADKDLSKVVGGGGFVGINDYRNLRTQYAYKGIEQAIFDNQLSDYLSPSDRAKYGIGSAQKWQVAGTEDSLTNEGEEEVYLSDENYTAVARALVKTYKTAAQAKDSLDVGQIKINEKLVKLSEDQIQAIKDKIDLEYPSGERTIWQKILPGGK